MSGLPDVNQSAEDMWTAFAHQAAQWRKMPIEVRAAYYAGCRGMLTVMLEMMQSLCPDELRVASRRLSERLSQISIDYLAGGYDAHRATDGSADIEEGGWPMRSVMPRRKQG